MSRGGEGKCFKHTCAIFKYSISASSRDIPLWSAYQTQFIKCCTGLPTKDGTCGSGSWIRTGFGSRLFLLKFNDFFNKAEFSNLFSYFSLILMLKLDEPFRNLGIFIISFFQQFRFGFSSNFFFAVFVDILPLGFGSVYPHICADSETGS